MFKSHSALNILFPVDDSPHSQAAVNLLTHIAWPNGTVAHVLALVPEGLPEMEPRLETRSIEEEKLEIARWRDWAAAKIVATDIATYLRSHNLIVNMEICEGQLAEMMLARMVDLPIDLIVTDAKRFNTLSKFQPGQMAHKPAHQANYASLLIVRPSAQIRPLNTILVIDDSVEAWRAVEFMCTLCLPQWAKVTVIHITKEEESIPAAFQAVSFQALAGRRQALLGSPDPFTVQIIDRLHDCGTQVWSSFCIKGSADEILSSAQAQVVDLMVIGAHHQAHNQPFQLEGLVEDIVKYAPCSVLVVR